MISHEHGAGRDDSRAVLAQRERLSQDGLWFKGALLELQGVLLGDIAHQRGDEYLGTTAPELYDYLRAKSQPLLGQPFSGSYGGEHTPYYVEREESTDGSYRQRRVPRNFTQTRFLGALAGCAQITSPDGTEQVTLLGLAPLARSQDQDIRQYYEAEVTRGSHNRDRLDHPLGITRFTEDAQRPIWLDIREVQRLDVDDRYLVIAYRTAVGLGRVVPRLIPPPAE